MTMDKMILHGLRCTAHIGCKPEERALPQALLVNVTIELDITPAAVSDDLGKTVNHGIPHYLVGPDISRCQQLPKVGVGHLQHIAVVVIRYQLYCTRLPQHKLDVIAERHNFRASCYERQYHDTNGVAMSDYRLAT